MSVALRMLESQLFKGLIIDRSLRLTNDLEKDVGVFQPCLKNETISSEPKAVKKKQHLSFQGPVGISKKLEGDFYMLNTLVKIQCLVDHLKIDYQNMKITYGLD